MTLQTSITDREVRSLFKPIKLFDCEGKCLLEKDKYIILGWSFECSYKGNYNTLYIYCIGNDENRSFVYFTETVKEIEFANPKALYNYLGLKKYPHLKIRNHENHLRDITYFKDAYIGKWRLIPTMTYYIYNIYKPDKIKIYQIGFTSDKKMLILIVNEHSKLTCITKSDVDVEEFNISFNLNIISKTI